MRHRRFRVYIAGPYAFAATFRALSREIERRGYESTARWIPAAISEGSVERLEAANAVALRAAAEQNDADILASDAVLVLIPEHSRPKETYCEARFAVERAIPVVWVGPPCLTSYRPGVVRKPTMMEAFAHLAYLADYRKELVRMSVAASG